MNETTMFQIIWFKRGRADRGPRFRFYEDACRYVEGHCLESSYLIERHAEETSQEEPAVAPESSRARCQATQKAYREQMRRAYKPK